MGTHSSETCTRHELSVTLGVTFITCRYAIPRIYHLLQKDVTHMQRQESGSDLHPVIDALEGTDCSFCDGGELVQDSYKGNDAVVCDVCGTPGAQLW